MTCALVLLSTAYIYSKSNTHDAQVTFLGDEQYLTEIVKDIYSAKKSVYCGNYMFKLDEELIGTPKNEPVALIATALVKAKENGVDVKLLLDIEKKTDRLSRYNTKTADILNKHDIEIYFDSRKKRFHPKMCVIDNNIVYIGSHNFTYSAMRRNNEVSVKIVSKDIAQDSIKYLNEVDKQLYK